MSIPNTAVVDEIADDALLSLGLAAEELRESVLVGYTAAANCTYHEPSTFRGTMPWGRGTGHLRDLLKTRGWRADKTGNFERTAHPSNSHCVVLCAGSSNTGREGAPPRTRNPKGKMTARMVSRNNQLSLDQGTNEFAGTGEPVADEERETWILLHYYDRDAKQIRVELSCPSEMTGKAITAWSKRIVLEPITFGETVEADVEKIEAEVMEIQIDVKRRAI